MAEECLLGGPTKENGNCTAPGDDGHPVQCIGEWSLGKHDYLRRYLDATRAVRRKYLAPRGTGGATFVDLFAGPGRARVRGTGKLVDGSPLIALRQAVEFTDVVLCDLDPENVESLRRRCDQAGPRVTIVPGDCNERIDDVLGAVRPQGFNVALVDPFNLKSLSFRTLAKLAAVRRMDLLIFFPVSEIKRNIVEYPEHYRPAIDRFLGTDSWQPLVRSHRDVHQLVGVLRSQLARLGYTGQRTRTPPIHLTGGQPLYELVYASKNDLGDEIWQSITDIGPDGQRWLF